MSKDNREYLGDHVHVEWSQSDPPEIRLTLDTPDFNTICLNAEVWSKLQGFVGSSAKIVNLAWEELGK